MIIFNLRMEVRTRSISTPSKSIPRWMNLKSKNTRFKRRTTLTDLRECQQKQMREGCTKISAIQNYSYSSQTSIQYTSNCIVGRIINFFTTWTKNFDGHCSWNIRFTNRQEMLFLARYTRASAIDTVSVLFILEK